MIKVPGGGKPHVPPHIAPKEAGKEAKKAEEAPAKPARAAARPAPAKPGVGRGPELTPNGAKLAVRLAALATEAKKKEIAAEEFERIMDEVIRLTGLKEPQAALEEANRKLQEEIELELAKIKANKELMDEADTWQKFGELLAQLNKEQVESFIGIMQSEIRAL